MKPFDASNKKDMTQTRDFVCIPGKQKSTTKRQQFNFIITFQVFQLRLIPMNFIENNI